MQCYSDCVATLVQCSCHVIAFVFAHIGQRYCSTQPSHQPHTVAHAVQTDRRLLPLMHIWWSLRRECFAFCQRPTNRSHTLSGRYTSNSCCFPRLFAAVATAHGCAKRPVPLVVICSGRCRPCSSTHSGHCRTCLLAVVTIPLYCILPRQSISVDAGVLLASCRRTKRRVLSVRGRRTNQMSKRQRRGSSLVTRT